MPCLPPEYRQYPGNLFSPLTYLNTSSECPAFGATPKRPLESDFYENSQVFDWMNTRNSSANFIYGDILGTFDELVAQLVHALTGDNSTTSIPSSWESSMIASLLKTNQKVMDIYCNLMNCGNELSEQYEWVPAYPFFAENHNSVLNAQCH